MGEEQNMERRKSDSNGKMALLMVLAAFFLIAAIYVIVRVISTIHKDYSMIEQAQESWTETVQTIKIENNESSVREPFHLLMALLYFQRSYGTESF